MDSQLAVVQEALQTQQTTWDVLRPVCASADELEAADARVRRLLYKTPRGRELGWTLLHRKSRYLLEAAAVLCCAPSEVTQLVVDGDVPPRWLASRTPSGDRAYYFWYTVRRRAGLPGSPSVPPALRLDNLFTLSPDELDSR